MSKRRSFAFEMEVRALWFEWPINKERSEVTFSMDNMSLGRNVSIDVGALVQGVFVSPRAPDWLLELVRKVCLRYGLKCNVSRSGMDARPLF